MLCGAVRWQGLQKPVIETGQVVDAVIRQSEPRSAAGDWIAEHRQLFLLCLGLRGRSWEAGGRVYIAKPDGTFKTGRSGNLLTIELSTAMNRVSLVPAACSLSSLT